MAEMTSLALSSHEYADLVHGVLDLVEQIVSSPFLSLAVREAGQIGHYVRVGQDVDPVWADEVERYVAQEQVQRLSRSAPMARSAAHHQTAPAAWIASFPAETPLADGGRPHSSRASLTLGCPRPLSLRPDEEEVMLRIARQALLVLDNALLVQQLENLETTDRLTGVLNHRRLLEILEYEMLRHQHGGRPLALMLLDVEGLNSINRSYGHRYGNHILQKLAGLLRATVRPVDMVARCGLDEFAVVLPETDEEQGAMVSEHLRERLLAVEFAGGAVDVTVGVAHVNPDEALTAEGLLRRGEQALQETKRQQRGFSALWDAR